MYADGVAAVAGVGGDADKLGMVKFCGCEDCADASQGHRIKDDRKP